MTQNGPLAPAFLTVCVDAATAAEKYGLPEKVLSLIIHAYGDVSEDTCENFGPHFNPFGVSNKYRNKVLFKGHKHYNRVIKTIILSWYNI